jgi:hypothetical protein
MKAVMRKAPLKKLVASKPRVMKKVPTVKSAPKKVAAKKSVIVKKVTSIKSPVGILTPAPKPAPQKASAKKPSTAKASKRPVTSRFSAPAAIVGIGVPAKIVTPLVPFRNNIEPEKYIGSHKILKSDPLKDVIAKFSRVKGPAIKSSDQSIATVTGESSRISGVSNLPFMKKPGRI